MSSLPNTPTFLHTYTYHAPNTSQTIGGPLPQNTERNIYERELNFLQEEKKYWEKEHTISPSRAIQKKIQKLDKEIQTIEARPT